MSFRIVTAARLSC